MFRNVRQGFPLLITRSYWVKNFSMERFLKALFVAFGAFWLIQPIWEILSDSHKDALRPYWWLPFLLAFLYAAREVWPSRRIECRLNGRDISIAIEVGDLFATDEAIVIGSNCTFDTDTGTN